LGTKEDYVNTLKCSKKWFQMSKNSPQKMISLSLLHFVGFYIDVSLADGKYLLGYARAIDPQL